MWHRSLAPNILERRGNGRSQQLVALQRNFELRVERRAPLLIVVCAVNHCLKDIPLKNPLYTGLQAPVEFAISCSVG